MADYDWFDHRGPTEAQTTAAIIRAQGFEAVFEDYVTRPTFIQHYRCLRGCGTLVWDVTEHIKNVCPTYDKDSND